MKILETNLYCLPTPKAADLRVQDKRTEAFEYILKTLSPTILLLHGKPVKEYFDKHHRCSSLTEHFSPVAIHGKVVEVAAVKQLSRVSYACASKLGENIRLAGRSP